MYYIIAEEKGFFESVNCNKISVSNRIQILFTLLKGLIRYLFIIRGKTFRNLYILHPRTTKSEYGMTDGFSVIENPNDSLCLFRSDGGKFKNSYQLQLLSIDFLSLKFIQKISRLTFNHERVTEYYSLLKRFCIMCDIDNSNILKKCKLKPLQYYSDYRFFKSLFRFSSVENLYLVDHYSRNVPATCAAKDLSIKCAEFQHGIITRYHIGYVVNIGLVETPGYPDVLYAFGDSWVPENVFPKSLVVDYSYKRKCVNTKAEKKNNQLIIISQSVLGNSLADYMLNHLVFELFELIIFQLHPGEYSKRHFFKNKFSKIQNLKVKTDDFYQNLNASKVAVGVFSTGMLEAYDSNCETFFVPFQVPSILRILHILNPSRKVVFIVHKNNPQYFDNLVIVVSKYLNHIYFVRFFLFLSFLVLLVPAFFGFRKYHNIDLSFYFDFLFLISSFILSLGIVKIRLGFYISTIFLLFIFLYFYNSVFILTRNPLDVILVLKSAIYSFLIVLVLSSSSKLKLNLKYIYKILILAFILKYFCLGF